MPTAASADAFRISDPSVVARYLQLRSFVNDKILARVEQFALDHYNLAATRRLSATWTSHVRTGFLRQDGGEIWPVVFLTTVDISVALGAQISQEWLAGLGTTLNGPQRLRHRNWEEWWGWEKNLGALHPKFYDLNATEQEEQILAFYREGLEWLAQNRLVPRK